MFSILRLYAVFIFGWKICRCSFWYSEHCLQQSSPFILAILTGIYVCFWLMFSNINVTLKKKLAMQQCLLMQNN